MKIYHFLTATLVLAAGVAPAMGQQVQLGGEARKAAARSAADDGEREWAELGAPVLGYWVRGTQVRLMLGVPGAAHLSEQVVAPEGIARMQAAPGHGWVLGLSKQVAQAWRPETGELWALEAVRGLPSLAAISPTGGEAAFYWERDARLVVYGGLPEQPQVLHAVDNLIWPPGLKELALAPGGQVLAGIAADGLYLLAPDAEAAPVSLHAAEDLRSVGFGATADRLAYLDAEAGALMLATRTRNSYVVELATGPGAGLTSPDRARLDAEGRVWVASSETGAVWLVEPGVGAVEMHDTAAMAGSLDRLRLRGAMLVSSAEEQATRVALVHDGLTELSWVPAPGAPVEVAAAEAAGEVRQ